MRDELIAALRQRGGEVRVRREAVEFCCPRHEDKAPSAWMRDHAWGCFSCDFSEPLSTLAQELGVEQKIVNGYTVEDYAREKKFSLKLLSEWGVETEVSQGGRAFVAIPYYSRTGDILRRKFRAGPKKWWEGRDLPVHLYGLDRLEQAKSDQAVLLVEGESDCHALWHADILALGVPGANTWRRQWADYIGARPVYVWQEPGQGGEQFVQSISASFPKAMILRAPEAAKDPSELFIQSADAKAFRSAIRELVIKAVPLGTPTAPVPYEAMIGKSLERLLETKKQPIDAVPMPLPGWNRACRGAGGGVGVARGWLVLAASLTGFGKSLIASNMAATAIKFGERPTYISLEMDCDEVETRTLAISAGVPVSQLEQGAYFNEETFRRASHHMEETYERTGGYILVNSAPIYKLDDILDSIRYNHEVHGSRFFLIDYLQLAWAGDEGTMLKQITEVSHAVRRITKDLRITTVGFSQFNRETSKNRKDPPTINGLMGGSPLENDAVQIALIDHTRFEKGERLDGSPFSRTVLDLQKNRHGPQPEMGIEWDYKTLRMRELMEDERIPTRKGEYE